MWSKTKLPNTEAEIVRLRCFQEKWRSRNGNKAMTTTTIMNTLMNTMKLTRLFSRTNLTLLALVAALAGALFFAGCATADGGGGGNSDSSSHQHHH